MTRGEKSEKSPLMAPGKKAASLGGKKNGKSAKAKKIDFKKPLQKKIEELEANTATLAEQLLRVRAESENQRKRYRREMDDKLKYANEDLARSLVSVLDNLQRALLSLPQKSPNQQTDQERQGDRQKEKDHPALAMLAQGIEGIEREFLAVFKQFSIERIQAKGEIFDPLVHEAMSRVRNNDVSPGTVVEEFRAGYRIHDRLLRPSGVCVSFRDTDEKEGDKKDDKEDRDNDEKPE